MKQAIRALSIATKILWVLVIIFSLTAVYSAASLRIGLGEPKTSSSNGIIALSTPIFVNNTGFYEITNLNITTHIEDHYDKAVSTSTTIVPTIPPSNNVQKEHSITLNLTNLVTEFPYLAFNDSVFDMHTFVTLRFANVIPIQMSANGTIPWGAPFYNFSVGEISLDYAEMKLTIPLTFENHAFFSINGTMRLEIYNNENEQISATSVIIDVPPDFRFEDIVEMNVDPSKLTREGQICVFFETPMFNVGPIIESWVI
jgi:hypothetical protein